MTSCSVPPIKYPTIMLTDGTCKQARHTFNRMFCMLVNPLHCLVCESYPHLDCSKRRECTYFIISPFMYVYMPLQQHTIFTNWCTLYVHGALHCVFYVCTCILLVGKSLNRLVLHGLMYNHSQWFISVTHTHVWGVSKDCSGPVMLSRCRVWTNTCRLILTEEYPCMEYSIGEEMVQRIKTCMSTSWICNNVDYKCISLVKSHYITTCFSKNSCVGSIYC